MAVDAAAAAGAPDADASTADATVDITGFMQKQSLRERMKMAQTVGPQFLLLDPVSAKTHHHLTIGVIKIKLFMYM